MNFEDWYNWQASHIGNDNYIHEWETLGNLGPDAFNMYEVNYENFTSDWDETLDYILMLPETSDR